jgi:hypothetical protein
MQLLKETTIHLFAQLETALALISPGQYTYKNNLMGGATAGQHVRHIIELFQEMLKGYTSGTVNYENRLRNVLIETDKLFAVQQLQAIICVLDKQDKKLLLTAAYGAGDASCTTTVTSYTREVMYNIEHAIHHFALIRIGFKSAFGIELPDDFGVAPATLKYRQTCAP